MSALWLPQVSISGVTGVWVCGPGVRAGVGAVTSSAGYMETLLQMTKFPVSFPSVPAAVGRDPWESQSVG